MRPVGAELFHEDKRTVRQTDGHDEANSRFSKFRERAKNKDPYFYRRFVVKLMYWLCFGENTWRRLEWIGRFLVAMETPRRIIAKLVVIATNPSSRSRLRIWSNYYTRSFYTRNKVQRILCTLETWFQFLYFRKWKKARLPESIRFWPCLELLLGVLR